MSEFERKHKTAVTTIGGDVFLSLPDDQYIQMTPEQARAIATKLFLQAAEAAGEARPSVVVFQ
ncbi:hypothetical protein [Arthrobacter sp. SAFR-014]|uniref:hypothetical protein n=1 Tax=unclassified Arthrobacter TaxID=235627 RepID=UPI003F7CCE16